MLSRLYADNVDGINCTILYVAGGCKYILVLLKYDELSTRSGAATTAFGQTAGECKIAEIRLSVITWGSANATLPTNLNHACQAP